MKWVVSFSISSRFGPRGRLDAMFMGRGDGVEVDADIVYSRRLCRSVVDFVADDAEDDYSVATRWYRAPELLKRL